MKRELTIRLVSLCVAGLLAFLNTVSACAPSPSDTTTEVSAGVGPDTNQRNPNQKKSGAPEFVEATDPESLEDASRDLLETATEQELPGLVPELMVALRQAPEFPCRIANAPGCPVIITAVSVRSLRVDYGNNTFATVPGGPRMHADGESFLLAPGSLSLKNNTDREITRLRVRVTGGVQDQIPQEASVIASLKPREVARVSVGDRLRVWHGIQSLTFQVKAAEFKDGKLWGERQTFYPGSPPPPSPQPLPSNSSKRPPSPPPPLVGSNDNSVIILPKLKLVRKSEEELRLSANVPLKTTNLGGSSGPATVQLIVAPTGKVVCAIFLSGPEEMRKAAIREAHQWRFKPTHGRVAVAGVITFGSK